MPTHKELPDDRPTSPASGRAGAGATAGATRFWSRSAAIGVLGVLAGTLIWFPLAVCGLLLFLLSLFVLKALT